MKLTKWDRHLRKIGNLIEGMLKGLWERLKFDHVVSFDYLNVNVHYYFMRESTTPYTCYIVRCVVWCDAFMLSLDPCNISLSSSSHANQFPWSSSSSSSLSLSLSPSLSLSLSLSLYSFPIGHPSPVSARMVWFLCLMAHQPLQII